MIEYRKGDLLASDCDVVVHGCNCKLSMGAGIAKQIKEQFPDAHTADMQTIWGDKNKLGTCTSAEQHGKTIINAYTQYNYTTREIDVDYDALRRVMVLIDHTFKDDVKIGMPRIGCGLAGGDWNIVENILNEVFQNRIIYVYDFAEADWTRDGTKWICTPKLYKNATWNVSMEGQ